MDNAEPTIGNDENSSEAFRCRAPKPLALNASFFDLYIGDLVMPILPRVTQYLSKNLVNLTIYVLALLVVVALFTRFQGSFEISITREGIVIIFDGT